MMRPEREPPSEFQEYTLVAIVAVASQLAGTMPGRQQVHSLAVKFQQDVQALTQVGGTVHNPFPPSYDMLQSHHSVLAAKL